MRVYLVAVGTRMPGWVQEAYAEYARRITGECTLELIEVPLSKRTKTASIEKLREEECRRLQAAVPRNCRCIAMDAGGQQWDTESLANEMQAWLKSGSDIALLVGGPDGLTQHCLRGVEKVWSLSRLTLPHPLVRVVVAEQLYRAQCILRGHPYHK